MRKNKSKTNRRLSFGHCVVIGLLFVFLMQILTAGIIIKQKYIHYRMPTKAIKLADIKSVQIINLDRLKDRREHYEKMLRDIFGDTFLGHKIGEEIRFRGVDGKKDVILENMSTGKKFDYNQLKNKDMAKIFNKDKWKGYIRNEKQYYIFFDNKKTRTKDDILRIIFSKFGCHLSFLKAISNVAKQPDGTWGIIFEDDFKVEKDFYKQMEKILSKIPADAGILKLNVAYKRVIKDGEIYHVFDKGRKRIPLTEIIKYGFYHGIFQSWNEHGYSSDWLGMSEDYPNDYLPSNVCFMIKAETARYLVKHYPSYTHPVLGNEGVIYLTPEHNAYVWLHKMPVTTNYDDAMKSVIGEKRLDDKK